MLTHEDKTNCHHATKHTFGARIICQKYFKEKQKKKKKGGAWRGHVLPPAECSPSTLHFMHEILYSWGTGLPRTRRAEAWPFCFWTETGRNKAVWQTHNLMILGLAFKLEFSIILKMIWKKKKVLSDNFSLKKKQNTDVCCICICLGRWRPCVTM